MMSEEERNINEINTRKNNYNTNHGRRQNHEERISRKQGGVKEMVPRPAQRLYLRCWGSEEETTTVRRPANPQTTAW